MTATVIRFWPCKKPRKAKRCIVCHRPQFPGHYRLNVSLDTGGSFPAQFVGCVACWKAGRLARGAEIELPEQVAHG